MPSSKSTSDIKRLSSVISESKDRSADYTAIERVLLAEASVCELRCQHMTPLPRVSHDQETTEKLKAVRAKYDDIRKRAKGLATVCKRKKQGLLAKADDAEKKIVKIKADEAKKAKKAEAEQRKKTSKQSATPQKKKKAGASTRRRSSPVTL